VTEAQGKPLKQDHATSSHKASDSTLSLDTTHIAPQRCGRRLAKDILQPLCKFRWESARRTLIVELQRCRHACSRVNQLHPLLLHVLSMWILLVELRELHDFLDINAYAAIRSATSGDNSHAATTPAVYVAERRTCSEYLIGSKACRFQCSNCSHCSHCSKIHL